MTKVRRKECLNELREEKRQDQVRRKETRQD